jgi:hypothetical protein
MIIQSASDLAHGLNDRLTLGLAPRPWNLYSPADTFWWLVPSTDWPAYRYGKLAFSNGGDPPRKYLLATGCQDLAPDSIFAGFNVEKGYGPAAVFVNPILSRKPAQLLDPSWLWFELTSEPGATQFSRTLSATASEVEVFMYVVVGYVHDRDSGLPGQHDAVMFRCVGQNLCWVTDNGCPISRLHRAKVVSTFVELTGHLLPIDEFHWVDLYVGTHVQTGEVDLYDLHNRVTSYFEPWLR